MYNLMSSPILCSCDTFEQTAKLVLRHYVLLRELKKNASSTIQHCEQNRTKDKLQATRDSIMRTRPIVSTLE
jgi:hypothetical protein